MSKTVNFIWSGNPVDEKYQQASFDGPIDLILNGNLDLQPEQVEDEKIQFIFWHDEGKSDELKASALSFAADKFIGVSDPNRDKKLQYLNKKLQFKNIRQYIEQLKTQENPDSPIQHLLSSDLFNTFDTTVIQQYRSKGKYNICKEIYSLILMARNPLSYYFDTTMYYDSVFPNRADREFKYGDHDKAVLDLRGGIPRVEVWAYYSSGKEAKFYEALIHCIEQYMFFEHLKLDFRSNGTFKTKVEFIFRETIELEQQKQWFLSQVEKLNKELKDFTEKYNMLLEEQHKLRGLYQEYSKLRDQVISLTPESNEYQETLERITSQYQSNTQMIGDVNYQLSLHQFNISDYSAKFNKVAKQLYEIRSIKYKELINDETLNLSSCYLDSFLSGQIKPQVINHKRAVLFMCAMQAISQYLAKKRCLSEFDLDLEICGEFFVGPVSRAFGCHFPQMPFGSKAFQTHPESFFQVSQGAGEIVAHHYHRQHSMSDYLPLIKTFRSSYWQQNQFSKAQEVVNPRAFFSLQLDDEKEEKLWEKVSLTTDTVRPRPPFTR